MAYVSLFDKLSQSSAFGKGQNAYESQSNIMPYNGCLGLVLAQLSRDLSAPLNNSEQIARITLNAPRIVRAAIDNKVDNPSEDSERILYSALGLALKIYSGSEKVIEEISAFVRLVQKIDPQLLLRKLEQPSDLVTWDATKPERSAKTAIKVADHNKGQDLLMIALAHGGIAAGMDVFLRYCDITGSDGSLLYAVRFSTQKLRDQEPRLSERERRLLPQIRHEKPVVIFDEDSASGATLRKAREFFSSKVFGTDVQTVANLDMNSEIAAIFSGFALGGDIFAILNQMNTSLTSPISPNMKQDLEGEFDQDMKEWTQKNNLHSAIIDTYLNLFIPTNLNNKINPLQEPFENPLLNLEKRINKIPLNLQKDNFNKSKFPMNKVFV